MSDNDRQTAMKFADHLRTFRTLPVLFVGSGISRRYLGTPDWRGLLSHFSGLLDRPITYYEGKTVRGLPGVATEIARDLYEVWWSSGTYADSRRQNQDLVRGYADPLKIEIARYIEDFDFVNISEALRVEIDALAQANTHAIITTNWDRMLEKLFPSFQSFVGQESVLFADTQGVGEMYKIHGSVEQPNSLVLTDDDYSYYEDRNPYLLAKMMTFFCRKSDCLPWVWLD